MPKASGLTSRMGPGGLARRLELLAAQIRMGRREVFLFSVEHTERVVMSNPDNGEEVVIDAGGNELYRLEVTPLESVAAFRARRRRRR